MRLSLTLGIPVRQLQALVSSDDFALYQAMYRIEPWGEERADLRNGILCATLANINRGKNTPPYKPVDFMPYADRGSQTTVNGMAPDAMFGVLKLFTVAHQAQHGSL